jgi:hypothetical protein
VVTAGHCVMHQSLSKSSGLSAGASESLTFGGGLREAVLRPITDGACARAFSPGNDGDRFEAARMLCATDVDGLAGCARFRPARR